ncbi:MAG TPA: hypothetical protein VGU68_04400 [Ktedonobacteraceae bacterium]|nr:hypothetical protein [Ktedonobacteraceae bacterium]
MFRSSQPGIARGCTTLLALLVLLLLSACAGTPSAAQATTPQETSSSSGNAPTGGTSFPTAALQLRTPAFGDAGQIAPTVKVLSSADPTLIVQFPLVPASIKQKFPDATAQVTVLQDTKANDFDAVTITVAKMPPNVKFTVFFTEIAAKPFGHAEYVGDVFTRSDGSGEATFHLITFVAFAADARQATVQSADQTGAASGIQLEHVGMWFDGVNSARQVLGNSAIAGTPFDGGHGALHAGPQAMTDGQTLPVI